MAEPFDELLGRSLDELTESAASIFDDDSDYSADSSKRGASSPPAASVASNYAPRELFAADADIEEEEKRARRRAQIASSSRRQRSRRKREEMELRMEAAFLESQLELLRSHHKLLRTSSEAAEWEERAITQRLKRRHAEKTNVSLKASVYQHARYLRDFRSVFSSSPMCNAELNLSELLHTYIHLPADPASRRRDYAAVCTNERLDLAMQIFLRETNGLAIDTPNISTRTVRAGPRSFGVTTVAAFTLDTSDIARVFETACRTILDCVSEWPHHYLANTYGMVVDAPADAIRYGISDTRYESHESGREVALEARSLSFSRLTDGYGALLFDFVDEDDLHPLRPGTALRRDEVGGILVRREVCADGEERVVGRLICSKLFRFGSDAMPPDVQHFAQFAAQGATVCGTRVYNGIRAGTLDRCHVSI